MLCLSCRAKRSRRGVAMETSFARKAKFWPSPQDYNEAVQNPHINLADKELKAGEATTNALGIPQPITGAFASVYKWRCADRFTAMRCFLKDIPDSQWRYGRIADHLEKVRSPYTVNFEFQFKGVQVAGRWFPILKMDWVDGCTLDNYLHQRINSGSGVEPELAEKFKDMCANLESAGIAHGDLQHGNIMVSDGRLVLVDYDGMFVPHINAPHSNELGHRNYQHPKRSAQHFGPYLDNFSAWVIYLSLKALALDPSLYERLGAGDDCLLFRSEDFRSPLRSCAFAALETHADQQVVRLARFIRSQLSVTPDKVPALTSEPPVVASDLPPLDADAPQDRGAMMEQAAAASPPPIMPLAAAAQIWSSKPVSKTGALLLPVESELKRPAPRLVKYNSECLRLNPLLAQAVLILIAFLWQYSVFANFQIIFNGHIVDVGRAFYVLALVAGIGVWIRPLFELWVVCNGTAARGKIVDLNLERKIRPSAIQSLVGPGTSVEHDEHRCWVTIEYQRRKRDRLSTVQTRIRLSDEEFRALSENEELTVVYLPSTPALIYRFAYFRAV